jgi:pimeloyl-ACP methyl ester carboxylesterase
MINGIGLKKTASALFSALRWVLCGVGVAALVLAVMIATPLVAPPELRSISAARDTIDLSALPAIERFQARDGTALGFRHYPATGAATGRVAILIHGSSGSSANAIHVLSTALAAHGVESYAVDIRGHGASGTRGDIGYIGQLEDDLADFVEVVRKTAPTAPLTLIGHSAGGGFALRVAGSPTNRPNSGGWASPDMPRIIALTMLRRLGIVCCDALPVLAFAVPPNSAQSLVPAYTERLRSNFATHLDFRTDLAAATRPVSIYSGADDELMLADKYAEAVRGVTPPVTVKLIDGINHVGIVSNPRAVSIIADDVATAGLDS